MSSEMRRRVSELIDALHAFLDGGDRRQRGQADAHLARYQAVVDSCSLYLEELVEAAPVATGRLITEALGELGIEADSPSEGVRLLAQEFFSLVATVRNLPRKLKKAEKTRLGAAIDALERALRRLPTDPRAGK